MTFKQELNSWFAPSPPSMPLASPPEIGHLAPSDERLSMPPEDGKPVIIAFLRHCGCPFAEQTLLRLRALASTHPSITFIAISHSSPSSTTTWLTSLGGAGNVRVIVDEGRELYARYGLGVSSAWHVLNPWSLWSVVRLGREEGIWNRPTESGTRWQTAGSWAVDGKGVVRWGGASGKADEVGRFEEALEALGGE